MKPDEVTALTVPLDPPSAEPDRALDPDPPLPGMPCPAADVAVADGVAAEVEADVAAQPESPITAARAAAAIQPLLFDSSRRTSGRRGLAWLSFMMALLLFGNIPMTMPAASMGLLCAVYVLSMLPPSYSQLMLTIVAAVPEGRRTRYENAG